MHWIAFPFGAPFLVLAYFFINFTFAIIIHDFSLLIFCISLLLFFTFFLNYGFRLSNSILRLPCRLSIFSLNQERFSTFFSSKNLLFIIPLICYILFLLLQPSVAINSDNVILSRFSGSFIFKFLSLYFRLTAYFCFFSIIPKLNNRNYVSSYFNLDNLIVIVLSLMVLFLSSVSEGGKGAILMIAVPLWIFCPYLLPFASKTIHKLLQHFTLSKQTLVYSLVFFPLLIFLFTKSLFVFPLITYLIVYYFAGSVECVSAVSYEFKSLHTILNFNYVDQLFEPLHVLGLSTQLNAGNVINNNLSSLPDLLYGGTNDSAFCWAYSSSLVDLLPFC